MSTAHNGNRRDFLKQSLSGAAFLCAGGAMEPLAAAEPVAAGAKSRVVVARDELLRGTGSTVDSQRMLALQIAPCRLSSTAIIPLRHGESWFVPAIRSA